MIPAFLQYPALASFWRTNILMDIRGPILRMDEYGDPRSLSFEDQEAGRLFSSSVQKILKGAGPRNCQ